jgi:hypothetical protein
MNITLELDTGGSIGELRINADGAGDGFSRNYNVFYRPRPHGQWSRQTRILNWPARHSAWALIVEAIRALELDTQAS